MNHRDPNQLAMKTCNVFQLSHQTLSQKLIFTPGFEPVISDQKSSMLTITPQDLVKNKILETLSDEKMEIDRDGFFHNFNFFQIEIVTNATDCD